MSRSNLISSRSRAIGALTAALLLGVAVAALPSSNAGAAAGDAVVLSNGWTFTDLGATVDQSSVALSINGAGDIVGYTANTTGDTVVYRAVKFVGGAAVPLGVLTQTVAWHVGDGGVVVGQNTPGGRSSGPGSDALRYLAGADVPLGPGIAFSVNAGGTIVGYSVFNGVAQAATFGAVPTDIDSTADSKVSIATDVNDAGTAVGLQILSTGTRGVRFGATTGPVDPTLPSFIPAAINNSGSMAGVLYPQGTAAIYDGTSTQDLGVGPRGGGWVLNDINSSGTTVGLAHGTGPITEESAVIRTGSTNFVLGDVLPSSLGFQASELKAINDAGSAVGYAVRCTSGSTGCSTHAIRLDPPAAGTSSTSSTSSTTSSTVAPTTSSTAAPVTSSSSTTSSTVAPTTSSTAAPTTSSTAAPTTSSTAAPVTSSSSTTSSTVAPTTSSTAAATTSSTAAPTTSSSVGATTSTAVEATSSSSSTSSTSSTSTSSTSSTVPGSTPATIALSSSSVARGQTLVVAGSGFEPASTVTVELHSTPIVLGTFTARIDGTFTATVTVPATADVGAHSIVATGTKATGGTITASASLAVTSTLPKTGSDVGQWAMVALLALGVGLVAFGRSRILASR